MNFFIFLVSFFAFLIVITVITTIIKLSLLVTTKYKYETYILIIPAILYIMLWAGLFILWFIISKHFSSADIFTLIIDSIFESTFNIENFKPFLLSGICCCTVGILLQPFVFLTVNIPYNNIRIKIKNIFIKIKNSFITKVLKKDLKPMNMPVNDMAIKEKWIKLKFVNALISSIFSFSIILISIFLLLLTSNAISKKILNSTEKDADVQIVDTETETTKEVE